MKNIILGNGHYTVNVTGGTLEIRENGPNGSTLVHIEVTNSKTADILLGSVQLLRSNVYYEAGAETPL